MKFALESRFARRYCFGYYCWFATIAAGIGRRGVPRFLASAAFTSSRTTGVSRKSNSGYITWTRRRRSSSSVLSSESTDADLARWEQMYNEGGSTVGEIDKSPIPEEMVAHQHEIRVVTFDLDNTLWKTSATIATANDKLAAFLEQYGIVQPVRVEKVMGQLFQETKERYAPKGGNAPVLLTRLRKDALRQVLMEHNDYSGDDAIRFADEAFDVWTRARHEAIPAHYATSVVPCLERITTLQTSAGQPLLIGAVTDGNSDPRNIPELSELFDFCINAEGVGVSKPDSRVYLEALNQIVSHPTMKDVFGSLDGDLTEEAAEDMVGPWWVHVGDDFVKDIVASKSLKMRSVWSRELIVKKTQGATSPANKRPSKSVEDFVKEVSSMKVIEMSVGAEDYLAESLQQEFADAVVDRFDEVHDVLKGWQSKAHSVSGEMWEDQRSRNDDEVDSKTIPIADEEYVVEKTDATAVSAGDDIKFCMHCGGKLPVMAKFCSSCGEKQHERA